MSEEKKEEFGLSITATKMADNSGFNVHIDMEGRNDDLLNAATGALMDIVERVSQNDDGVLNPIKFLMVMSEMESMIKTAVGRVAERGIEGLMQRQADRGDLRGVDPQSPLLH